MPYKEVIDGKNTNNILDIALVSSIMRKNTVFDDGKIV